MENISGVFAVLIGLGIIIFVILVLRAIGAWMLRINEVISKQAETNEILIRIYQKLNEK